MKNKKLIIISISAIALILILSFLALYKLFDNFDGKSSVSKDPHKITVANFKDGKVTLRDAQLELDRLKFKNENLKNLTFETLNISQKESIIKEIILKKITYKEAKKRNLDKDKDYQEALNIFKSELLKQKLYADISKKAINPENVRNYYDQLVRDLENKKEVKLSYIAVEDENEANSIFRTLTKDPDLFAKEARLKSIDEETAKKGGDLGFVLEDILPAEILTKAQGLKRVKYQTLLP